MTVKDLIAALQAQIAASEISENLIMRCGGLTHAGFVFTSLGELCYHDSLVSNGHKQTVKEFLACIQAGITSGELTEDLTIRYIGHEITMFRIEREEQGIYGDINYKYDPNYDLEYEAKSFRVIATGRLSDGFIEEEVQRILNGEVYKGDQLIRTT